MDDIKCVLFVTLQGMPTELLIICVRFKK